MISQAEIRNQETVVPQRTLSFPLDVPRSRVLHTVELILPNDAFMHINEPCECILRIKQSPYWASEDSTEEHSAYFVYEVEADYDNWLLSGKRKLKFNSKVSFIITSHRWLLFRSTNQNITGR